MDRRQLLTLTGSSAALAGCTSASRASGVSTASAGTPGSSDSTSTASSTTATASAGTAGTAGTGGTATSPASSATTAQHPTATSVAIPLWTPDANDVSPEVKLLAAQYVETTVAQAAQVVFGQYGGILATTASVLVITHPYPTITDPAVGSTYDVRLVRSSGAWQVTEVHPSTPGTASGSLTSSATQVLASARIDLPPASHADIVSGQVHESVLNAMLTLSRSFQIGVSVVRSGHPTYVFGTSRLSDHPKGRAFDTWRINEQPVVSASTPRNLITAFMQAAAGAGSYNVGGPYQLNGSTFFSDNTHHDHVHAGFTT